MTELPSTKKRCLGVCVLLLSLSCRGEARHAAESARQNGAVSLRKTQDDDTSPLFSVTGCHPSVYVLCVQDTAIAPENPDDAYATAGARWILFGAKDDSVQISARPNVSTPRGEGVAITSNMGEERDSSHDTAPYLRRRVAIDGVIWFHLMFRNIVFDEIIGDTVKYTLRVRREKPDQPASLRATGQRASLTLVSARSVNDAFSLIPVSLAKGVTDFMPWKIFPGTYRVLLVPDSLYQLCRLPCSRPDTVKLTPSVRATKEYK